MNKIEKLFLLNDLSDQDYALIQEEIQLEEFSEDAIILKQGQQGQKFFMLVEGSVEVILEGETEVRLATLKVGNFFGEMSCLTGEPVSATIRALEKVTLYTLTKEGLLKLLEMHPKLMRSMLDQLLKRISQSNLLVHQEHLKSSVLLQSVSDQANKYGKIIDLSEEMKRVQAQVGTLADATCPVWIEGETGVGKEFIANRLHYDSIRQKGPLLKVSGLEFTWEEWRKKRAAAAGGTILLSKADQLPAGTLKELLDQAGTDPRVIMMGGEPPAGFPVEIIKVPPLRERREDLYALIKEFLRREGVVSPEQGISGSAIRKLAAYPFLDGNVEELFQVLHKAVILSDGATIQAEHIRFDHRRRIHSRPRIGLALGAGIIRGVAHVGVLKVLEEEGIPIDLIAGSSVGSLVGLLYAAGMKISTMEELLPTISWRNLVSFTRPTTGLTNNAKMGKWLKKLIGDPNIEDLPIPFACVATDGQTGMPVIMKSGSAIKAVRASTAIQMVMKPVYENGKVLWDGAMAHKVPVHLVRSMGADIVIGVDVGLPTFKKGTVKNLYDAFMFPLDILQDSLAQEEMELADILLKPVADASGYSFKNVPIFLKKGEEETRKAIPYIRKVIAEVGEA
jgi:predicted acylesterase/phospholipase RssA/CRP-like cAMP-binding protein